MTPDKWQKVKLLFEESLEQEAMRRGEFLARSCPDDAEVRDEVLRLLAERERTDTEFLAPPGAFTLLDRMAKALAETGERTRGYEGEVLAQRYLVEREIGRGGSGVVYLAQDRQLHSRRVVVKLLHAGWEDHERVRVKFRQEIEALSRIHHPGVVGVLDVGQAPDGRSFLVMEYVEGETLRARLQKGALDLSEAARILEAVCDGLETAHRNGIFHRDLKPENIMLSSAGEGGDKVKLIDFGIAKVQDSLDTADTETISVVGTVRYAAPEQLMGRAGPRSDIFSLGVLCYEMLTGRPPFEPETPFQLLELQRAGKISRPSRLRRDVPEGVDRVILLALSFRAEDRQPSAREFASGFRAALKRRLWQPGMRIRPWVLAVALLAAFAGADWLARQRVRDNYDRAIEFSGGRDPEEFGFRTHLDLTERTVPNSDHTGYDAIRLLTSDQGMYYRKVTPVQAYAAMRGGWKMTAVFKPIEGGASVDIDLSPADGRYDCSIFLSPSHRQVVQLTRQIANGSDGLRYEIEGAPDAFHNYELIFDPEKRAARLLVDGVERLRGYRGHHEFVEGYGLMFGTALYKSAKAEAVFRKVRFEINHAGKH
jgi:predicted Ser/Thr protein kinase